MYEICKSVISEGRFNLTEMLEKIDTLWVQGSLSDDEKTELVELAQSKADVGNSVDIMMKLQELDARITALENGSYEPSEEYPEYVIGKWYYNGDKITCAGDKYICIAPEGQVCTWSPFEYPAYWEKQK